MINIINSRIIFKAPIKLSVMLSAIIGISGLAIVFISQMSSIYPHHAINHTQQLIGLILCVIATFSASLGNMASAYNQQQKLPIVQSNAYGMLYGTLFTIIIAVLAGQKPTMSWTLPYISSLFYLAIFGSIITFGSYLKLLGQIGPGRAAYIFVIKPVIALIISSFFEGFQWHIITVIGIILILLGNILALYKPEIKSITKKTTQIENISPALKLEQQ
jgi:drug/metabolite transporter (DMT)-like permease